MCNCISEATGRHEKFWWRIPPSCLKRNSRNCWLTLTSPSGADCPLWGRRRRRRRKVVSGQGKEGWGQIKREGGQVDIMIRKYQFWMVFFFEGHYPRFYNAKRKLNKYVLFFSSDIESRPTSISAETWKLISQEKTEIGDQNETDRNVHNSEVFTSVTDTERSNSRNSQIPVLPEINRSGSLIAQWNNERPSSSNSHNSSVLTIKNSFNAANVSDSIEIMSIGSESVASTPRPPSGDKPSNLTQRARMDKNMIQSTWRVYSVL